MQRYRKLIGWEEKSVQFYERFVALAAGRLEWGSTPDHFYAGPYKGTAHQAVRHSIVGLQKAKRDLRETQVRLEHSHAVAAHHEALRKKYEQAALHPWEAVAPDPPEPAAPANPSEPGIGPADPPAEPSRLIVPDGRLNVDARALRQRVMAEYAGGKTDSGRRTGDPVGRPPRAT